MRTDLLNAAVFSFGLGFSAVHCGPPIYFPPFEITTRPLTYTPIDERVSGVAIDLAQVEKVMAVLQQRADKLLPFDFDIHVVADSFPCSANSIGWYPGEICTGETSGDGKHVVISLCYEHYTAHTDCVAEGPLAHELTHVLFGDGAHTRPELWGAKGLVESTMFQVGCPDVK